MDGLIAIDMRSEEKGSVCIGLLIIAWELFLVWAFTDVHSLISFLWHTVTPETALKCLGIYSSIF